MLIVISAESILVDEVKIVNQMFEAGLQRFHFRKPNCSDIDCVSFLKQIPNEYKNRVFYHQNHSIVSKYKIGGIHLTEKLRKSISEKELQAMHQSLSKYSISLSSSIHQIDEIESVSSCFESLFISPVFDSISKQNYLANESILKVENKILEKRKLIALGGITTKNIDQLKEKKFFGVAILGSIWNHENPYLEFQKLQKIWEN